MNIHISATGLDEHAKSIIAGGLMELLADSYTLYLQTQNFHWNITGPDFVQLHQFFEQQYTEMATAVDDIAERIRALGSAAPGTFGAFEKLSSIVSIDGVPEATEMIDILASSNERVVLTARRVFHLAQQADDESTASLVSDRLRVHEKAVWMMRAMK